MTDSLKTPVSEKLKKTFTIRPEVFTKLNMYSAQKNIPYSVIIEALLSTYFEDSSAFPNINFENYK